MKENRKANSSELPRKNKESSNEEQQKNLRIDSAIFFHDLAIGFIRNGTL
jgi:hypothetical protein